MTVELLTNVLVCMLAVVSGTLMYLWAWDHGCLARERDEAKTKARLLQAQLIVAEEDLDAAITQRNQARTDALGLLGIVAALGALDECDDMDPDSVKRVRGYETETNHE